MPNADEDLESAFEDKAMTDMQKKYVKTDDIALGVKIQGIN